MIAQIKDLITGSGLDMSLVHVIHGACHRFEHPSQLYRPCLQFGVEELDFVFAENTINLTKFFRILLYEWFLLIRSGGKLILSFQDNSIADKNDILREIYSLRIYRNAFEIIKDRTEDNRHLLAIEKTASIKRPDEEVSQWTFGIVTNGKRIDFVKKSIETIRSLNIPEYEISICGTFTEPIAHDTHYIQFAERDELGWITRKKNMICEKASFPNIAVLHDRIYLDPNFYDGMKQYGPQFDVLSCPVRYYIDGAEPFDTNWDTVAPDFKLEDEYKLFHTNGRIDPTDWDWNTYIAGSFIVVKKEAWKEAPWNENLYWGDAEDIELSHRQHKNGLMLRYNPYARCHTASYSGIMVNQYYENDDQKLGQFHPGFGRHTVAIMKFLDTLGVRRNQKLSTKLIAYLKKRVGASSWKEETKAIKEKNASSTQKLSN